MDYSKPERNESPLSGSVAVVAIAGCTCVHNLGARQTHGQETSGNAPGNTQVLAGCTRQHSEAKATQVEWTSIATKAYGTNCGGANTGGHCDPTYNPQRGQISKPANYEI